MGDLPEAHACHSSGGTSQSLMTTMMTWTCKRGSAPTSTDPHLAPPTLQPLPAFHPNSNLSSYFPSAMHP